MNSPLSNRIWIRFEAMPPFMVRLMARQHATQTRLAVVEDEPLIDRATKLGMSVSAFHGLQWSETWEDVPLCEIRRFCDVCQVDIFNRRVWNRYQRYLNSPATNFGYLRRSPNYSRQFEPMLRMLPGLIARLELRLKGQS